MIHEAASGIFTPVVQTSRMMKWRGCDRKMNPQGWASASSQNQKTRRCSTRLKLSHMTASQMQKSSDARTDAI